MEGLIPREDDDRAGTEKYPQELRERAMRLVAEAREQDWKLSLNTAMVHSVTGGGVDGCGARPGREVAAVGEPGDVAN
jgi:hypothetical protein